jgi:spore maturation protein CgeB
MGAGGFLLTSYGGDFGMYFKDGEDYVSFDSVDDLINKCRYYLDNEDERRQIAANAYEKICESHTYLHRVKEMLG